MVAVTVIAGALLIGVTVGLLGSGGSTVTVPVLVYLVGHDPKIAIAESMAIVGVIALTTAIPFARRGQVDWRSVAWFGVPGMAGTYSGAWLGGRSIDAVQLVVFGIVLLLASIAMIRRVAAPLPQTGVQNEKGPGIPLSPFKLIVDGLAVGGLTGFVGVGGGFLIVPALVIFGKLPMRLAMGTSLVIIVFNSATGFLKYHHFLLEHGSNVDGSTIFMFGLIGIVGSLAGQRLNSRLNQRMLQLVFTVFLIVIGSFVVIREGSELIGSPATPQTETTGRAGEFTDRLAVLGHPPAPSKSCLQPWRV
jgi:uncharacterized membrane protein YfcA